MKKINAIKFNFKFLALALVVAFISIIVGKIAFAHQPIIERNAIKANINNKNFDYSLAREIKDPTTASVSIYGNISMPNEIDIYTFTAQNNEIIPIEILVPKKVSSALFHPTIALIADTISENSDTDYPINIPNNYKVKIIDKHNNNSIFYEPFSMEAMYQSGQKNIEVVSGHKYYIAVYTSEHNSGDYVLAMGTKENFDGVSFLTIIKDVFLIKMGVIGEKEILWADMFGLFMFVAGFIFSLGSATITDTIGFLGRKSGYWLETAIRIHKITKIFYWVGLGLALIGGSILYRENGLSGVAAFQLFIAFVLMLNGLYFDFVVSSKLLIREKAGIAQELLPLDIQKKIGISFIISFIGWWSAAMFLVWYLLMLR